ncbi:MAG: RluA family pseudouridine synthase [Lewinellaceae bacterium]|nr:RluA family pseudouridine synthase [Lewinellaceae bacterium]
MSLVPILYESPHLLVINKPGGIVVERDPHGYPSIEEWALDYLAATVKKPYAGIVHRLDRPVSGVLLIAKKKSVLRELNRQFEQRSVEKIYLAVVEQVPDETFGTLEHWISKDQKEKRAIVRPGPAAGAFLCSLSYELRKTLPHGRALLEVRPHTGKFHQIRVQLAAIGCPIVGDEKYGATSVFRPDAIALHAWKLGFTDPVSGEQLWVEAPADF